MWFASMHGQLPNICGGARDACLLLYHHPICSVYTCILQLAMFGGVDCSLYSVRSRLVAGKHVDANICAIIYVNMYVCKYPWWRSRSS